MSMQGWPTKKEEIKIDALRHGKAFFFPRCI
jgi:hypothetical protein